MKNCSECGKENREESKFCLSCGHEFESALQPQNLMKCCPSCNAPVADTDRFCPKCGRMIVKYKYCPKCGNELKDGDFCSKCGAEMNKKAEEKDGALALLALIFSILGGILGLILGIVGVCIYKEEGKNRTRSGAAIAISFVWAIIGLIIWVVNLNG